MNTRTINAKVKEATARGKNLYMHTTKHVNDLRIINARSKGAFIMVRLTNGTWMPFESTSTLDIR